MAKRDRTGGGSPPTKKTAKDKSGEVCVTCNKRAGEDSIECECCFKWEHRVCAGVSQDEYAVLTDSSPNIMFFCGACRPKVALALKFFNEIEQKQKDLDVKVKQLEEKLNSIAFPGPTAESAQPPDGVLSAINSVTSHGSVRKPAAPPILPSLVSDMIHSERKFNVVIYGIAESPPKTSKETRLKDDLNNLLTSFKEIDSSIEPNAIKDFFRLGKFKSDSNRPRPLLVKFLRSTDAINILQNKTKLSSGIYIKPDLSPEERAKEAMLLKERHLLIQKGVDRRQIKLRNYSIFIDNKPHCRIQGSQLEFNSSSSYGPNTSNSSVPMEQTESDPPPRGQSPT